jgi:hypothetical protein
VAPTAATKMRRIFLKFQTSRSQVEISWPSII